MTCSRNKSPKIIVLCHGIYVILAKVARLALTHSMICWCCSFRQHAITCANVSTGLCSHTASLAYKELTDTGQSTTHTTNKISERWWTLNNFLTFQILPIQLLSLRGTFRRCLLPRINVETTTFTVRTPSVHSIWCIHHVQSGTCGHHYMFCYSARQYTDILLYAFKKYKLLSSLKMHNRYIFMRLHKNCKVSNALCNRIVMLWNNVLERVMCEDRLLCCCRDELIVPFFMYTLGRYCSAVQYSPYTACDAGM